MKLRKYPIIKKALQVGNNLTRKESKNLNLKNSILLNSIPKSGTHLLHQILAQFGYTDHYGFYASTPSISMIERKSDKAIDFVNKIKRNELTNGHIFFNNTLNLHIKKRNLPTIFLYRDPRAIFVSEIHYLSDMNKWHRCHKYYKQCNSFKEKFNLCLNGIDDQKFYYPPFKERINRYIKWINQPHVLSIRYEDLIDNGSLDTVLGVLIEYISKYKDISNLQFKSINPHDSHTYTGMDPNRWKIQLSNIEINTLNTNLKNELIELDY